jgi:hypothetical protein
MVSTAVPLRMLGMNDDPNRSESLKLTATAERSTSNGTWQGECSQCGTAVELGFAGTVPVHEPPRTGGLIQEGPRHVQVRATDVIHNARELAHGRGPATGSGHPP